MNRALTVAAVLTLWVCMAWAQAPQGGAAAPPPGAPAPGAPGGQAGRGGGGGGRGGIAPRIVSFEAKPTSIKPGESFVLSWAAEAGSATIDNGVGPVPPRGSTKVTPKATTTYTITVAAGVTRAVTVTVAGTTPVAASASAASDVPQAIPRIDGKPDFSGIYGFTGMAGFAAGRGGRGAQGAGSRSCPGVADHRRHCLGCCISRICRRLFQGVLLAAPILTPVT